MALRRIVALVLYVLAACQTLTLPAVAEKRVALVIGNGVYQHTRSLPNARSDARMIGALLGTAGFIVTEVDDVTYERMREALRAFGQSAQDADVALVYYAGHGMEVARENWLLPVSAVLRHERDLEYEAISLSSILGTVKDARRLRLVILDACRNNPISDRIELSSPATRSVPRGLARIEPSADILVAYSAKHGTLAEDGPSGGNSPFATALAQHLVAPGLDLRIAFGKVRDDVRKATGGRQEPFTYGSVGGETIAIIPGSAQPLAPALSRPAAVTPPSGTDPAINVPREVKPQGTSSHQTLFHTAESDVRIALVKIVRSPLDTEIHLQTQAAVPQVCWNSSGPDSPYLVARGRRYRFLNGDRIAMCPTRQGYTAREVMVLRFEPLEAQVDEFSLVEGQGGENQTMGRVSSALRFWNFLRVRAN